MELSHIELAAPVHPRFAAGREHAGLRMQQALDVIKQARGCARCRRAAEGFVAVGSGTGGDTAICVACSESDRTRDAYRADLNRLDREW
jgi:hypothetical protein